jgi:hypothetical protein
MKRYLLAAVVVVAFGAGVAVLRAQDDLPWAQHAQSKSAVESGRTMPSRATLASNEVPWAEEARRTSPDVRVEDVQVGRC